MTVDQCRRCSEDPESVYRCQHCGRDLVDAHRTTTARNGGNTDA